MSISGRYDAVTRNEHEQPQTQRIYETRRVVRNPDDTRSLERPPAVYENPPVDYTYAFTALMVVAIIVFFLSC